jgi:hypothetical protein
MVFGGAAANFASNQAETVLMVFASASAAPGG